MFYFFVIKPFQIIRHRIQIFFLNTAWVNRIVLKFSVILYYKIHTCFYIFYLNHLNVIGHCSWLLQYLSIWFYNIIFTFNHSIIIILGWFILHVQFTDNKFIRMEKIYSKICTTVVHFFMGNLSFNFWCHGFHIWFYIRDWFF